MLVNFITSFMSLFTTQLFQLLGIIVSPLHSCLSFIQYVFSLIIANQAFLVALGWIKYFFPPDVIAVFVVIVACETAFLLATTAISLIKGLRYWILMRG